MITIISSTNRPESITEIVSQTYFEILRSKGADVQLFSLSQLPADFISSDMYIKRSDAMNVLVSTYVEAADKIVFVIPEYNGSYPGILKTFIDTVSPKYFREKKAGMIGVSDGHAGNLRGLEHLSGVLNHMRMLVHFAQPKLSNIDKSVNEEKVVTDERALKLLNDHADRMIAF